MNKRHKHYETIVAWAEGKEIQFKVGQYSEWENWNMDYTPSFHQACEWRIKPEPKPDVVRNTYVEPYPIIGTHYNKHNLRLTFDGETGKLKQAEVIDD